MVDDGYCPTVLGRADAARARTGAAHVFWGARMMGRGLGVR